MLLRTINTVEVYANSGYWADIQAAADQAMIAGGGIVYIPEGRYNFVNISESWTGGMVKATANVKFYGAPTEKDANGQVIEWKTILEMPWEVPVPDKDNPPIWFDIQPPETDGFRFSDIKLVGWRYFDYLANGEPNWKIPYDPENPGDRGSETMYIGLRIYNAPYLPEGQTTGIENFRVDHCCFQDMGGSAVWVAPGHSQYNRRVISGVIDHNRIVNSYGDPGRLGSSDYEYRTLGYGIGMRRWAIDFWEDDFRNVIMRYNNYSIFIENNYFSKWRHCAVGNDGLHYVFRYNIIDRDYGVGSVDSHGSYATADRSYAVGTRAAEIYGNTFKNPAKGIWDTKAWAINIRGGCGIITNNTLIGYDDLVWFNNEWGNVNYQQKCSINNTYIWNNILGGADVVGYLYGAVENVNYFLRAPNITEDGFEYMQYPWPHPLTLEEQFTTPFLQELEEGVYEISVPSIVTATPYMYNFKQWNDGDTNPIKTVTLDRDIQLIAEYELVPPEPTTVTLKGFVKDTTGNPLADADIQCNGATAKTLQDGSYEIAGLEPKQYNATFSKTGYQSQTMQVDGSSGGTINLPEIVLSPAPTVSATGLIAIPPILVVAYFALRR